MIRRMLGLSMPAVPVIKVCIDMQMIQHNMAGLNQEVHAFL